jgi:hypothetical protein
MGGMDITGVKADLHSGFSIGNDSGVIPRAISEIFEQMEKEKNAEMGVFFSVYCSFMEIYNEKIYDILSYDDPLLQGLAASTTTNSKDSNSSNSAVSPNKKGKTTESVKPAAASSCASGVVAQRVGWNRAKPVKEAPSLPIRQKLDGSVFIDGLTLRNVSSKEEMLQAFREVSSSIDNDVSYRIII